MTGTLRFKILFSLFVIIAFFAVAINCASLYFVHSHFVTIDENVPGIDIKDHYHHFMTVDIRDVQQLFSPQEVKKIQQQRPKLPKQSIAKPHHHFSLPLVLVSLRPDRVHPNLIGSYYVNKIQVANTVLLFIAMNLIILGIGFAVGIMLLYRTKNSLQLLTKYIKLPPSGKSLLTKNQLHKLFRLTKRDDDIAHLAQAYLSMSTSLKESVAQLTRAVVASEHVEKELAMARQVQLGLLPQKGQMKESEKFFDIYAFTIPSEIIGGDFYDFFMVDDDHLYFALGDAEGKSIHAAIFTTVTKTLLHAKAQTGLSPGKVMTEVNRALVAGNRGNSFATVFIGVLNVKTGELRYANAGHLPPIIVLRNERPQFITENVQPVLGVIEKTVYDTQEMSLAPKELLILYSDGVTEAEDKNRQQFSDKNLLKFITSQSEESSRLLINKLFITVKQFSGKQPQSDDITALALRYISA